MTPKEYARRWNILLHACGYEPSRDRDDTWGPMVYAALALALSFAFFGWASH